jgi:hypothetical protein
VAVDCEADVWWPPPPQPEEEGASAIGDDEGLGRLSRYFFPAWIPSRSGWWGRIRATLLKKKIEPLRPALNKKKFYFYGFYYVKIELL